MSDYSKIEQSIDHLMTIGVDFSAHRMRLLLDVAKAAGRIYDRPMHSQSDEDRMREALTALQEHCDE